MNQIKCNLGPLFGGFIFALGLGISGMTEPSKIIGFLDIFGNWDPSLIFVMVGAIAIHAIFYRLILKRSSPVYDKQFHLPTRKDIDKKLIIGAAIFGVGWGITGLCPGPGLVSLVTLKPYALVFVAFMILGILIGKYLDRRLTKS